MTPSEFYDYCEEIATERDNEDWNSKATLRGISREIGVISLESSEDSTAN